MRCKVRSVCVLIVVASHLRKLIQVGGQSVVVDHGSLRKEEWLARYARNRSTGRRVAELGTVKDSGRSASHVSVDHCDKSTAERDQLQEYLSEV